MITAFIILYAWGSAVVWYPLGVLLAATIGPESAKWRRWALMALTWPALPFVIVVHGWWRRTRR